MFFLQVAKRSEEAKRENPEVTPHFVCMSGGEEKKYFLCQTSQISKTNNISTEILVAAAIAATTI